MCSGSAFARKDERCDSSPQTANVCSKDEFLPMVDLILPICAMILQVRESLWLTSRRSGSRCGLRPNIRGYRGSAQFRLDDLVSDDLRVADVISSPT